MSWGIVTASSGLMGVGCCALVSLIACDSQNDVTESTEHGHQGGEDAGHDASPMSQSLDGGRPNHKLPVGDADAPLEEAPETDSGEDPMLGEPMPAWDWLNPQGFGDEWADVWARSGLMFAVGSDGMVLRFAEGQLSTISTGLGPSFAGVHGFEDGSALAITRQGHVATINADGTLGPTTQLDAELSDVWGSSPQNVWASDGRLFHFDGAEWSGPFPALDGRTTALWGSGAADVWAVGSSVQHFDGSNWVAVTEPLALVGDGDLITDLAIDGTGPDDVWLAGIRAREFDKTAVLLHFDGEKWQSRSPAPPPRVPTRILAVNDGPPWFVVEGALYRENVAQNPDMRWVHAVAGQSSEDLWLVGDRVAHLSSGEWSVQNPGTRTRFNGMLGWGDTLWAFGEGGVFSVAASEITLESELLTEVFSLWGLESGALWAAGEGGIARLDDAGWQLDLPLSDGAIRGLWGSSEASIWAVGDNVLYQHDGDAWQSATPLGTLFAVGGSGPDDVWAGGFLGLLLHYDGEQWEKLPPPTSASITMIYALARDDVWFAAGRELLHFDGSTFTVHSLPITVYSVVTDDARVWALGTRSAGGPLLRLDGESWTRVPIATGTLRGGWLSSEGELWVAGDGGALLRTTLDRDL